MATVDHIHCLFFFCYLSAAHSIANMYHSIYSVSSTPQPGVPADQQGYVQQFGETQPQSDQNQRPSDSSGYGTAEFSSIFASLYSNPQQSQDGKVI